MAAQSSLQLRNRILKAILVLFCFALFALDLARPINLTAVDIGRHIKNGELILQGQADVLRTNFYSFTHPDYPFINHHWLFGVMSYDVWKAAGFNGLSIIYIVVLLAALFFFLRTALLRVDISLAIFFAFVALPILSDRREIRPEGISILFMGIFFYLLTLLSLGRIRRRTVFGVLAIVQLIWVNTHIFFFMGPLLVAVFWWEGISRGCTVCGRALMPLFFLTLGLNVINPSGLAGALTPLNIFKEFGYRLAENQNIFFMMGFFPHEKSYIYYLGMIAISVIGMSWAICVRGWKINAPFVVLTIFIACAGLKAVRLMMPFGFFFIPLTAFFYGQVLGVWPHHIQNKVRNILMVCALIIGVAHFWELRQQTVAVGLMEGVNRSAEFFKQSGLKGPIFSNYDIGGYLIYHLAGQEKVFVDNRQEAFPPEFFKDVYVPMQEDEAIWQKTDAQYQFNVIYFYRHDLTPWGQGFLINRVKDPAWAPVFVDSYTIIFLKRNSASNQDVIKRYELPLSMFGIERK